ncbi:leucine-rich repeat domain-containing protein [Segatella bryantii]|uniref:leucine-rich repeat domain-containing protein n=1 Tax=Segatella bryantii TaxID=77095 RepID=UPI00247939F1|nr:leucine-rich repeat domain-containing protein [Segatella bryantii]
MKKLYSILICTFLTLNCFATDVENMFNVSWNSKYKELQLLEYTGDQSVKNLDIPGNFRFAGKIYRVTDVADMTFSRSSYLESVTLPSTVKKIGYSVFSDCKNLKSVTLPNSLSEIGSELFSGCI